MKLAVFTVWIPVEDDDKAFDALLDRLFELEKSEGWAGFDFVSTTSG